MRDLIKEEADKYQDFFNFMSKEHNLTLTVSEMDEIIIQSQKLVNNLLKPDVSGSLHYANEPICNKNGTGSYCSKCGDITKCNDR